MSDSQLQRKLNQISRIANELDDEAKVRYGAHGMLFFSDDGGFHLMDGDSDGTPDVRTKHIRFSSRGYCRMGAGAW